MAETPRTEAVAALARLVHFACVEVDGEWALAHQPEAHERALTVALRNLPTNDRRSIAAALRSEAQDTAASSGLRAALDQPASKLARAIGKVRVGGTRSGHFFDEDGWRFLLEAVAEARAALAHSTPEPSLRDALAAALHSLDDDLQCFHRDARNFPVLAGRLIAALPGLSLSAQPSETGETDQEAK